MIIVPAPIRDKLRGNDILRRGGFKPRLLFSEERGMEKKIDQTEVRKAAKLSRLDLSEAEVGEFTGQLSAILEYVEKMNELDTADVEPLAHCLPISNVFREDSIKGSLGTEKTLSNAPERDGAFFKVPKILDD